MKPKHRLCVCFRYQLKKNLQGQVNEHKQLGEKVFVLKISMCPFNTSKHCEISRGSRPLWATEFIAVWRQSKSMAIGQLLWQYDIRKSTRSNSWTGDGLGKTLLTYMFTDNESGTCFGPKQTTAVDAVPRPKSYYLSDTKYSLCLFCAK